jgi:uncharacterized protein (TIGR02270 family)
MGVAGRAVRREDPDGELAAWVCDRNPLVSARALKAIGEFGRIDLLQHCRAASHDDFAGIRFAAARAGATLGDVTCAHMLSEFAGDANTAWSETAVRIAARRLPQRKALLWQNELAIQSQNRLAVIAAGEIGDPALVPWLIEAMSRDEIARPAGDAFRMITGVDLAYDDLERDAPEGFESGPGEDPDDDDVALDPDEDSPWPDPALVSRWWTQNRSRFRSGIRYLAGQELTLSSADEVLRHGTQPQRAAAALELVLLRPGPLFETRARGDQQRKLLGVRLRPSPRTS